MQKRIVSELLRPGLRLPGPLLDEAGGVLVDAGAYLTEDDLHRLRKQVPGGPCGNDDWPDHFLIGDDKDSTTDDPPNPPIRIQSLRSGTYISHDIYDADTDVLLLAAGMEVTPRFLELLRLRGMTTVKLRTPRQTAPTPDLLRNAQTEQLDALLADELRKKILFRRLSRAERPRLALADLKAEAERGAGHHVSASRVLADICHALSRGRRVAGREIRKIIGGFVAQATLDVDLLPLIVSAQQPKDEYLFDHCLNVALLSIAMAAQGGLEQDQLTEIGFGALLQDIGMLRVPDELRLAPRVLTSEERSEITRHPIHTLDWLERISGVPLTARFIAYQSHERVDGRGYPRRRASAFVHRCAKLAGIADSFAAMTRPRPYRGAFMPYEAAKAILIDRRKFDRAAVRMFLDTVSLCPIGSLVQLSGGIRGRVLRANPGAHTRPIIEQLDTDGRPTGRIINLAKETDLEVIRAVRRPSAR